MRLLSSRRCLRSSWLILRDFGRPGPRDCSRPAASPVSLPLSPLPAEAGIAALYFTAAVARCGRLSSCAESSHHNAPHAHHNAACGVTASWERMHDGSIGVVRRRRPHRLSPRWPASERSAPDHTLPTQRGWRQPELEAGSKSSPVTAGLDASSPAAAPRGAACRPARGAPPTSAGALQARVNTNVPKREGLD